MITWKPSCNIQVCIFRSKMDAKFTGRSYRTVGESFPLLDSEYADDTAVMFDTRNNLFDGIISIISHFARFGNEVHRVN